MAQTQHPAIREAAQRRASSGLIPAFLACTLAGCAIKTPHLAVQQYPVEKRAAYFAEPAPYSLIVTPLIDRRPEVERKGQQAAPMFLLLVNRRVGDYYTGDRVFGRQVPAHLADRVAAHLQAANAFQKVTFLPTPFDPFDPNNPHHITRLAQTQGGHFVLTGELEHFYGSQHQHFSMTVLPLYFLNAFSWQDSKNLPNGKTVITFALHDAAKGDIMWRHQLQATSTMPRDTDSMAQAAMESFVLVSERLTSELRKLPLKSVEPAYDADIHQE
jgi:hypothetical protein